MSSLTRAAVAATIMAISLAGCAAKPASPTHQAKASASSTPSAGSTAAKAAPVEKNPPGDIPDNIAYVSYANASGHYTFKHPEGWASTVTGVKVVFTDKLNGVTCSEAGATAAPTVSSANSNDVPKLRSTMAAFELRRVSAAKLPAGSGVLIVYRRNSAPDAVTGKVFRDEVQRYEIYANGREITLELYGAVGSDNVDPYRIMAQSLHIA
ncbi:MAG: hypothetical protein WCB04_11720 [Mycobacteriales bacterium]